MSAEEAGPRRRSRACRRRRPLGPSSFPGYLLSSPQAWAPSPIARPGSPAPLQPARGAKPRQAWPAGQTPQRGGTGPPRPPCLGEQSGVGGGGRSCAGVPRGGELQGRCMSLVSDLSLFLGGGMQVGTLQPSPSIPALEPRFGFLVKQWKRACREGGR